MRQVKKQPEKETMRARDMLRDLRQAQNTLAKLQNKGKSYDQLIGVLTGLGEDVRTPSSTELQSRFSTTPARLRKWIEQMYEDFLETIQMDPDSYSIQSCEHVFYIKGYRDTACFSCRLPVTPRVGERVNLPFLRAKLGTYFFYVSDVGYSFNDSELMIEISLRAGFYNQHFHYLSDQADFEENLPFGARISMGDYELKRELKKYYK